MSVGQMSNIWNCLFHGVSGYLQFGASNYIYNVHVMYVLCVEVDNLYVSEMSKIE
jgi:hypothetical protein